MSRRVEDVMPTKVTAIHEVQVRESFNAWAESLLREAGFEAIALTELNPSYLETRKMIPNAAIFSARVSA